ncbi:Glycoprotein 3-alpha-L-fucosyltransferase A [Holothuria leucospilota]|uniref:Fucosyltransferase n=1 Tax=Holothuria leucospilota TaxID=206669 RepID=A0A9Q1CME5_HOLLE|nr:Glycoprotein 3-alpha-L-fucosyltransferase A [Holothuria leucospilota]
MEIRKYVSHHPEYPMLSSKNHTRNRTQSVPTSNEVNANKNMELWLTKTIKPPSSCDVSVLIIGFHLDSWNKSTTLLDRTIECGSLHSCVQVQYRPSRYNMFNFNVVMFSHLYMEIRNFKSSQWFHLLKRRSPEQRWVMFSLEPPVRVGLNTSVPKRARLQSFHWTSTYDLQSDIPIPYGRYLPFDYKKRTSFTLHHVLTGKTKLIAFISSNCDKIRWPRTEFVRTLQRFVNIDMYGRCGDILCGENCNSILKQYKFILALENAPCRGYITEKFWHTLNHTQAVPIVFGPLKGDYVKIAPPHSFIHIYDFSSIFKLAEYIKYLDKNDTAYLEYHTWKNEGEIGSIVHDWSRLPFNETFCAISKRYQEDMEKFHRGEKTTFRDVNGADWLDTCQVHAIRPRGYMDYLPIPIL